MKRLSFSPLCLRLALLLQRRPARVRARARRALKASPGLPMFDVLFGPAYKGIPFAAATALLLHRDHGITVGFAYNSKDVKDHREGGILVGAPVKGKPSTHVQAAAPHSTNAEAASPKMAERCPLVHDAAARIFDAGRRRLGGDTSSGDVALAAHPSPIPHPHCDSVLPLANVYTPCEFQRSTGKIYLSLCARRTATPVPTVDKTRLDGNATGHRVCSAAPRAAWPSLHSA
ncbi:hypothetical protein VTO73DRAFT_1269 [Trametes versicolor]